MSTYTNLGIEKMVDGAKANTWGQVTNTNWDITEDALSGKHSIALSDQNTTIATYNNSAVGSGNETRKFLLEFSGTLSQDRTITLPTKDKVYGVKNSTGGGFSLVFTCGAGDNVTITNGKSAIIHTSVTGGHCVNMTDVPTDTSVSTAISKIPSSWTNSAQSIFGLTDTPSSIGTAGQVLKVNSGATALEFAADDSGSGSGGDADTLDGQQPSYYLNYNNFSNTPNLSGYLTSGSLSGYVAASAVPSEYASNLNFVQSNPTVGTMVFAAVSPASTTTYSFGSTIAGSNLLPTGAITTWGTSVTNQAMNSSSAMSGTWKCLGQRQPHPSNTFAWTINIATLWIRTS
tara:strand:- start:4141 stop:5175 length:1035 start_codon:yes stop_codon:yes gene_type:complete